MAKPIPEGMHTVTPQLIVEDCAGAIELYKKAFGAIERMRAPDPTGKKVWHAELQIGDSILFINDAAPEMGALPAKTRLWLYVDKVDTAFKRAVDAGCSVRMEVADMFWGDRMGSLTDRYGNEWTIATHVKDLSPEEMKKAQDAFVAQMKK